MLALFILSSPAAMLQCRQCPLFTFSWFCMQSVSVWNIFSQPPLPPPSTCLLLQKATQGSRTCGPACSKPWSHSELFPSNHKGNKWTLLFSWELCPASQGQVCAPYIYSAMHNENIQFSTFPTDSSSLRLGTMLYSGLTQDSTLATLEWINETTLQGKVLVNLGKKY